MNSIKGNKPALNDQKFYDLDIFWNLFAEGDQIPNKLKDLAANYLVEILSIDEGIDLREAYI